ncbi:MAG: carboxypeptidase-like regulatory domain-containing protein [Candidatus Thermoplasmatota archaeon]|nr:carboxypeptidase-like regulatory domain-containing protein [Candidatus Thermoplasmatota archaeon]
MSHHHGGTPANLILLTDADFETATHWASPYLQALIRDYAQQHGIPVRYLHKSDDVKDTFVSVVDAHNPILVTGCGHGSSTTYTGYQYSELMKKDRADTRRIAPGRHFVLLSCKVGAQLLPWLVQEGAVAAQGYRENFTFVIDEENYPNSYATWFFTAHCEGERALIEGATHSEAFERVIEAFTQYMNDPQVPTICKPYLKADRDARILVGDGDARITTAPPPPENPVYPWGIELIPTEEEKFDIKVSLRDASTGEPLAGRDFEMGAEGDPGVTLTTDGQGAAFLRGCQPGTYWVRVGIEGYLPFTGQRDFPPDDGADPLSWWR